MNGIELDFTIAAWIAFMFVIVRIPLKLTQKSAISILALFFIGWCFLDATQIVTIDEGVGIGETSSRILPTWLLGELRTTDLVFAIAQKIASIVNWTLSPNDLKALHVFFCVLLFAALIVVLVHLMTIELEPSHTTPAFIALLLLPTNLIAVKVLNYDFFVMLLISIAVFLTLLAFRTRNFAYLWIAIPVSALAAQEKMIAAPLIYITCFCAAFATVPRLRCVSASLAAPIRVTLGLLICAGVVIATCALLALLRPADATVALGPTMMRPLTQFVGTLGYSAFHLAPDQYSSAPFVFFAGFASALIFFSAVRPLHRWVAKVMSRSKMLPWDEIASFAVLSFLTIAIVAYVYLPMYWAPYHPVPSGAYEPKIAFNGATIHFASASLVGHLLSSSVGAMAMFWIATPTAVWVALISGLALCIWHKQKRTDVTPQVIVCCALAMPVVWGVLQLPTGIGGKYFNLGILLLSVSTIWIFLRGMKVISRRFSQVFALAMLTFFVVEIALFLPLCFDFRPFFVPASVDLPRPGEPTYGWPGWGEEVALAAKGIEMRIPPNQGASLHYFYPGAYFGNGQIALSQGAQNAHYTKTDYFVVSRLAVVEQLCKFPANATVEFTIGGFRQPYAWVFRGDRLSEAEFRF